MLSTCRTETHAYQRTAMYVKRDTPIKITIADTVGVLRAGSKRSCCVRRAVHCLRMMGACSISERKSLFFREQLSDQSATFQLCIFVSFYHLCFSKRSPYVTHKDLFVCVSKYTKQMSRIFFVFVYACINIVAAKVICIDPEACVSYM